MNALVWLVGAISAIVGVLIYISIRILHDTGGPGSKKSAPPKPSWADYLMRTNRGKEVNMNKKELMEFLDRNLLEDEVVNTTINFSSACPEFPPPGINEPISIPEYFMVEVLVRFKKKFI